MSGFAKFAALLAIVGMGCVVLGTAIVLSRSCCSADCEKCPVSFCKDANANLAKKIVSPGIAPSGVAVVALLSIGIVVPIANRILEAPRLGFVRPMRN